MTVSGIQQQPNWDDIIEQCESISREFADICKKQTFYGSGMWNSEVMLFASCAELCNINRIVESGRARGHSTKLLAEYFTDTNVDIISIEKERGSKNDRKAKEKLAHHEDVELVYGDSRELIESYTSQQTAVLIDGPKSHDAGQLAKRLIKRENIRFVGIHDVPQRTPHRSVFERLFNAHIHSDNERFVEEFKGIDEQCWDHEDHPQTPYENEHVGENLKSYGPTLGVYFERNNSVNKSIEIIYDIYLNIYLPSPVKSLARHIVHRL